MFLKNLLHSMVLLLLLSPIKGFGTELFGHDVEQTYRDLKESTINLVNEVTTFDPDPVLKKRDEVINVIRARQAENYKKMSSSLTLEFTEAKNEERKRKTQCSSIDISSRLHAAVQTACNLDGVKETCNKSSDGASIILQSIRNKHTQLTGGNITSRLKKFYNDLKDAETKVNNLNMICLNTYENHIQKPECLNSYSTVLNDTFIDYLKFNCPAKIVISGVNDYIALMSDVDVGVGGYILEIKEYYSQLRTTEAGIAVIKANIKDTIIEWETRNSRVLSSSVSKDTN